MPSYIHRKLVEKIFTLDAIPADDDAFRVWVSARAHLDFLKQNAMTDELVIYGSGPYTFIHSLLIPNVVLDSTSPVDLLNWSCNPFTSIASYCTGGSQSGMWIERKNENRGTNCLSDAIDLIFARTFEGWSGDDVLYFEVLQEYTHLAEIHWRAEEQAYCRFDENGDLRHAVSITTRTPKSDISLVSFGRQELDDYLAIGDFSLLRMFDFTLLRREAFSGWPDGPEVRHEESDSFFFRQKNCGTHAYTRGVQIIRPSRSPEQAHRDITDGWYGKRNQQYVEFLAHDWRNNRLAKISTIPSATTNYFQTDNSKPFELSPAFFRPEVLSRYKTDREKYIVKDREISCRAAWHLRGYDVNDAGQVHAYICDLRMLPYSEQLHWLSFNEEPKTCISERAFANDFKGEFVTYTHPREAVMDVLHRWKDRSVEWWTLRDRELLIRANVPLTTSKDEWSDAVMDIAKIVVEGFEAKVLRARLDRMQIQYLPDEKTLSLVEKLLNRDRHKDDFYQLDGMREAQRIRSKVKGHASGSEARRIVQAAITDHGSFKEHFTKLCARIAAELECIELHFESLA